jgi:hypothetical protein
MKSSSGIPETVAVTIRLPPDDREEVRIVPSDKYPVICPGFRLPRPRVLDGIGPTEIFAGENVIGWSQKEAEELFPDASGIVLNVYPNDFMRLLAKIAHGYIQAEHPDLIIWPLLRPFILGRPSPVAHLIGGDTSSKSEDDGYLRHNIHRMDYDTDDMKYVGVSMRLFADLDMPRYHVIVGQQVKNERFVLSQGGATMPINGPFP